MLAYIVTPTAFVALLIAVCLAVVVLRRVRNGEEKERSPAPQVAQPSNARTPPRGTRGRGAASARNRSAAGVAPAAAGDPVVVGAATPRQGGPWFPPRTSGSLQVRTEELLGAIAGPTRFSYLQLRLATNGFRTEIGRGRFGIVYKGTFPGGTMMAIKRLENYRPRLPSSAANTAAGASAAESTTVHRSPEAAFIAAVSSLSRLQHSNVVPLLGYCMDGKRFMLANEYMANGNLDDAIFAPKNESFLLSMEARCRIALDVAKGIRYLHEECKSRLLHGDVKLRNVLLNEEMRGHVADYGLASLYVAARKSVGGSGDASDHQSAVFVAVDKRATSSYTAPECGTTTTVVVSDKMDIYAFGIVVLEMVTGRRNLAVESGEGGGGGLHQAAGYLPAYVISSMEAGRLRRIVDRRLEDNFDEEKVERLLRVALLCVKPQPEDRPGISRVVALLQGHGGLTRKDSFSGILFNR
ncbi:hypothetical protein CBR_g2968 [Chara braunii]|uniref:Protein kinase domain-containing protein n=1 Tax=Chara braunii TaxID=69332 RepID=A0A388KEE1_CHABU|nr:hypothetical protein CBR_g2968 [Chara braunii]|eukprot:GBG68424.1 hypothetical protein CBR_g2968 [Chara braunii]